MAEEAGGPPHMCSDPTCDNDATSEETCVGCGMVEYCSTSCRTSHGKPEHNKKCIRTYPKKFNSTGADSMEAEAGGALDICPSWNNAATPEEVCIGCRKIQYCSSTCRIKHWGIQHKRECMQIYPKKRECKQTILSVPTGRSTAIPKIPFRYEDFVRLFNSEKLGHPPCGIMNIGKSCSANAVFQCLAYTRPLSAYLLGEGHKKNCQVSATCFFCKVQTLMEMVNNSNRPLYPIEFVPILISSGNNFMVSQDAHKFMRSSINAMQSACLHEYEGVNIVQHIFGGCLQYQDKCTRCHTVSNKFANMMDLLLEIHPAAGSLHECLYRFTAEKYLTFLYWCPSCKDRVMARQKLSVEHAPNILTVLLKRDQGQHNQRVTFPENLDLRCYMSDSKREDENYEYKLYAVVIVVIITDFRLAASWSRYFCYVKDFSGNWYKVEDDKVLRVAVPEVLEQNAYILLYSRIMDVENVSREAIREPAFPSKPYATSSSSSPMKLRIKPFSNPPSKPFHRPGLVDKPPKKRLLHKCYSL